MRAYITIIDDNDKIRAEKIVLYPFRIVHNDTSMTTNYEFQFRICLADKSLLSLLTGGLKINGCK